MSNHPRTQEDQDLQQLQVQEQLHQEDQDLPQAQDQQA